MKSESDVTFLVASLNSLQRGQCQLSSADRLSVMAKSSRQASRVSPPHSSLPLPPPSLSPLFAGGKISTAVAPPHDMTKCTWHRHSIRDYDKAAPLFERKNTQCGMLSSRCSGPQKTFLWPTCLLPAPTTPPPPDVYDEEDEV